MEDIILQRKVILSDEQYNTIKKDGKVEVDGVVLYDEEINDYLTIDDTYERIATLRSDLSSQINNNKSEADSKYSKLAEDNEYDGVNIFNKNVLLPNSPTTPETYPLTSTYTNGPRQTAEGQQRIVDGSITTIEKITGDTVKSTNLIPFPYETDSTVKNGLTFTVNNDGTILVNGTATAQTEFTLVQNVENFLIDGQTYYFKDIKGADEGLSNAESYFTKLTYVQSGVSTQVVDGMFTYDKATFSPNIFINIRIANGFTVNNLLFHPMLNEGDTALPYSPYFSGLKHTNFSGIKSTGKNLFDINNPIIVAAHEGDKSQYLPKIENVVIYNGGIYGQSRGCEICIPVEKNADYTFSFDAKVDNSFDERYAQLIGISQLGSNNVYSNSAPISSIAQVQNGFNAITVNSGDWEYIGLASWAKTQYSIAISNLQIEKGTAATEFTPYTVNTYQLPETVELAKYDYINPQKGEYAKGTRTIVFDGTKIKLTYGLNMSTYYSYALTLSSNNIVQGPQNIIASNGFEVNWGTNGKIKGIIATQGNTSELTELSIWFNKTNFTEADVSTLELANAYLRQLYNNGNPLTISYKLKTPTIEKLINIPQSYTVYDNGTEYLYDENSIYGTQTTVTQTYYIHENEYEAANKAYVQNGLAQKLDKTGGTITGHLIVENGTDTTLSALVVKNNDATYGLALDNDDTYKLGKGSLDDTGSFNFDENEGHPITLRDDSSHIKDNSLLRWDSTTNRLVDSGMSPDRIKAELNGEVTILTVEGDSFTFINTAGFSEDLTVIDFGDGTIVGADEFFNDSMYEHRYTTSGIYCIKIYGAKKLGAIIDVSKIKIGNNVTSIAIITGSMKEIVIPESLVTIDNNGAFLGCTSLTTVVMKSSVPPSIGVDVFTSTTKIIVPYEALETYKSAAGWSDYATIIDSYVLVSTMENRLSDILAAAKSYTDENTPVIERLG